MSISVKDLSFSYASRPVLSGVSFTAEKGRVLAVLGPNGAGKTTLFGCILGLLRRYTGSILLDGVNAAALSAHEAARRVAYIPQLHGTPGDFSALDMALMGTAHSVAPMSVPKAPQLAAAREALDRLGIAGLEERSFARLSGGEQQLVLTARALAQQAETLIMDEPTASLDYGNQARVLNTVRALARQGYTVVFSTHDPQHALRYADDALALEKGRVAAFGPVGTTLDAELIKRLYGMSVTLIDTAGGALIAPEAT